MRAIHAAALLLILLPVAGFAQEEQCVTLECMKKELDARTKALEETLCLLDHEGWERDACLLRQLPPQRICSSKKVPQEQIECLESALDSLMRSLPAIVADQVKKELRPRIHQ